MPPFIGGGEHPTHKWDNNSKGFVMKRMMILIFAAFFIAGCSLDSSNDGIAIKWIWDNDSNKSLNQKIMDSQMKPYNDAKKRGDL